MGNEEPLRDRHLLRALLSRQWAILPEKLQEILAVVQLHAAGVRLTAEEIEARTSMNPKRRPQTRSQGNVAVLPIYGVLLHRASPIEESSGVSSTMGLMRTFDALVADPAIKAIVLDVDSPGGEVFGIDEFASAIHAARGSKHVSAVATGMMASAAYYLASQASEVIAAPGTFVGSIGVFTVHQDVSKAMEMEGVTSTVISAGKYKADAMGGQPLTDVGREMIQALVDDHYDMFVKAVARGRNTSPQAVRDGYGQGKVLTAGPAVSAGLVDRVATLDDVLGKLGVSRSPPAATQAETPEWLEARASLDFELERRKRQLRLRSR